MTGWVQSTNRTDLSDAATSANSVTITMLAGSVAAGNTVLVVFGWSDAYTSVPIITDNAVGASNTYTSFGAVVSAGEASGCAVGFNIQGGPTQFTISRGGAPVTIIAYADEYNGYTTLAGHSSAHGTGTTIGSGSVTTTSPALGWAASWDNGAGGTATPVAGWTQRCVNKGGVIATADQLQTAAGVLAASFNTSSGTDFVAHLIAMYPAPTTSIGGGQQIINIGSAPNDGSGDPLRTSFDKTNQNFTQLYEGAGSATGGLWNFDATSTDTSTAPVSGRFKTNSGNYRTATQIAIHGTTIQGIDRTYLLRTQLAGDIIQCQDSTNSSAWCRFILQSNPVDNGTWFQLSVASEVDGGVASGNNQEIIIVCTANNAGVSGGGNVSNSGTPTSGQLAQWTDATHIQGIAASSLNFAPINSPTFTGDPKAPTPTAGDNDTSIATTAFVAAAVTALNIGNYAPIASPTFTGDPKAPTPATADNDTSIATTAFVKAQSYLQDAPSDGSFYVRQNAAWVNASSGRAGGWINKFRNPNMDIAQRGTSGSVTAGSTAYTLDGWMIAATGAAAAWSQQYNSNLTANALRISCATGLTACTLQQRIESVGFSQTAKSNKTPQPITIQFSIYNGTSSTITPQLATGYGSTRDNFGTVTADLAATALQSIPVGTMAIVAYTVTPSVAVNGYQVQLLFGGALNAASGYVDIGYADIRATPGLPTGLNNNPPPVELRPTQPELAFCQRYYDDPTSGATGTGSIYLSAYANAGGAIPGTVFFQQRMRAVPTVAFRNVTYGNASGLAVNAASQSSMILQVTATATGIYAAQFDFTASAEL